MATVRNFPIRGPKRTSSPPPSPPPPMWRRGGQTSGPSKLDGFNRRLIIVWIFHRAIFLLNNVQREIQRSLLSSIRAYPRIPSTIYSFFQTFWSKLRGSSPWMKRNETNEGTKLFAIDNLDIASRDKDWNFRSLEYENLIYRFFLTKIWCTMV